MKPGGYADGGADIAFALMEKNIRVVTPVKNPTTERDLDWVFPDTEDGIQLAISKGANTLWLNTVLYNRHPITKYFDDNIYVVGQDPASADIYDDKWITNDILRKNKLPIPDSVLISRDVARVSELNFPPPYVLKPVRGRGSAGVNLIHSDYELSTRIQEMFDRNEYGKSLYIEPYLPGQEVTISKSMFW